MSAVPLELYVVNARASDVTRYACGSVTVRTAHKTPEGVTHVVASVYPNAVVQLEPPWLVVLHDDPGAAHRCITRIPAANVVQVVEQVVGVAS